MAGQSDKHKYSQAGRTPFYGRPLHQEEDRTGNLLRIPTKRIPRQVLYSQLPEGQLPRGRPHIRYKNTIKINLKKRDIDTNLWKSLALQQDVWRDTVK